MSNHKVNKFGTRRKVSPDIYMLNMKIVPYRTICLISEFSNSSSKVKIKITSSNNFGTKVHGTMNIHAKYESYTSDVVKDITKIKHSLSENFSTYAKYDNHFKVPKTFRAN